MVMFDWGGMPQKTVFHSMELFAKHVMPHFRGIQSGQTATIQGARANTGDIVVFVEAHRVRPFLPI